MGRRLKNPKPLTALIVAGLVGAAGVYAWSASAKAKDKKKAKKKSAANKVQLIDDLVEVTSDTDAPWLVLQYCDTESGRATLERFTALGKTTSQDVELFAMSSVGEECEPFTLTLDDGSEVPVPGLNGLVFGTRLKGSWLEIIAGEDQAEAALFKGEDNDAKIRSLLAWAAGEGVMPLERSIWVGDPEPLWVDWNVQPPVIQTQIDHIYDIPIPLLDPTMPYTLSSSDEFAVSAEKNDYDTSLGSYIKAGTQYVQVIPLEETVATIISVQQGEWKKQALIRAKALPLPPVPTP